MKEFYRQATPTELQFYEQTLYPLQDKLFEVASLYGDKIYLTGGTALARFYFGHRLSDDLDFFTITDDLKPIATDLIARLEESGFAVEVERLELYFARFYIVEADCRLKVEFAREYNLVGELTRTQQAIFTNSLADIGANKITAFEDRAEIKDIIDLYYITQRLPLAQLFELADRKRVPIAYENLLAIHTIGITGRALVTEALSPDELSDFTLQLKRYTELELKKKVALATENMQPLVERLLWDFPPEDRVLNPYSRPVLARRLRQIPLPNRIALEKILV
jgi:hypothetical protein